MFFRNLILPLCLIACFLFTPVSVYSSSGVTSGKIIILDGTSNAGKTTIAKPLLQLLGPSYTFVALDTYVTDLWLEKKGAYLPAPDFVKRVHVRVYKMYEDVKTLVQKGHNVLLDTIITGLTGENDAWRCCKALYGLDIAMVLVYCPLPTLIERMKSRNEKAFLQNDWGRYRPIIVSLKFYDIYRVAKEEDSVLDMLSRYDVEQVFTMPYSVSNQDREQYREVCELFLSQFDLRANTLVSITPILKYDCVLNTGTGDPNQLAQKIYDCLMTSNMGAFGINCETII